MRGGRGGPYRKKVGHVVAEGAVVGVLHDGHELDGVVAEGFDAGEDVGGELVVGADFFFFGGHADVGFVDS